MNVKELIKPRYKVIADFPSARYKIGHIIECNRFHDSVESSEYFAKYPAIFKPLQWWEERKESDMPKYLRVAAPNSYVHPAKSFKIENGYIEFLHGETNDWIGLGNMIPATEEEYLERQKQKEQYNQ